MTEILPPVSLLTAFLLTSLVLAVTPGPGVFYVVSRSIMQGRRVGLASVAGVAMGNLGNAIGASIGLAALFSVSSVAFITVKWTGAIYLIYLGVSTIFGPTTKSAPTLTPTTRLSRVFRDGFIVALLNPKTAVFFAAFLPQFMTDDSNAAVQSVLLGSMFVAIAATTDTLYALGASSASAFLTRSRFVRRGGHYLTGSAFIGLGLFTACSEYRPK